MSAAPPQVALTAAPAQVRFVGAGTQMLQVRNTGRVRVVVDVLRAGFALDLRGSPRVVQAPPSAWVTAAPRSFALQPRAVTAIRLRSRPPKGAVPGDHTALLLLATRPVPRSGLAVRMRLGVVVTIRVPGKVVHRLAVQALRLRRRGRLRALELHLSNRGNVTEVLAGKRLTVTLWRRGRRLARLRPAPCELLPRSRGIVELRYRGPAHGPVVAKVALAGATRIFDVRF